VRSTDNRWQGFGRGSTSRIGTRLIGPGDTSSKKSSAFCASQASLFVHARSGFKLLLPPSQENMPDARSSHHALNLKATGGGR
jgi:hypothetical protein